MWPKNSPERNFPKNRTTWRNFSPRLKSISSRQFEETKILSKQTPFKSDFAFVNSYTHFDFHVLVFYKSQTLACAYKIILCSLKSFHFCSLSKKRKQSSSAGLMQRIIFCGVAVQNNNEPI